MMRRAISIIALMCAAGGCATPPVSPDPPARDAAAAPAPLGATVTSNAGRYVVEWRTEPSPIPLNEPFTLVARVREANGTVVAEPVVTIDARMPHHRHGMTRVPIVTRHDAGEIRARGLLFHMPGDWQMYVDVTDGVVTERAQINVVLD